MLRQPEFDFTHRSENNSESREHLRVNRKRFDNQCDKVLRWLKQGGTLTCDRANEIFMIKHLPRRISDLKFGGVPVKSRWIQAGETRVKEYFLDETRDMGREMTDY
jgi:hypothetical protein